ncbi:substrate-binding periplasmic protein [Desulfocurvus sp. DL9XJH121]
MTSSPNQFPIPSVLLVLLLCLLCQPLPARAQQPPEDSVQTIRMAFGNYAPPFYVTDGASLKTGLFVDFLRAFEAAYPNYHIKRVVLPRKRIDHALRKGAVDAFALNSPLFVPLGDRERYAFSLPLVRSCDHVAVRPGAEFEYQGPASLKGRTLGLVLGNGYGPLEPFMNEGLFRVERAQGEFRLLRMLDSGYLDAAVLNGHTARSAMRRNGMLEDSVVFLDPPVYCFHLAVQVQREHLGFVRDLDEFIAASRENGALERLVRIWRLREEPRTPFD